MMLQGTRPIAVDTVNAACPPLCGANDLQSTIQSWNSIPARKSTVPLAIFGLANIICFPSGLNSNPSTSPI
jgi:hypothetical protein